SFIRSWSGFATPPGSSSASYSFGSASRASLSTGNRSALSRWWNPWISPFLIEISSTCAPAFSTAARGCTYSLISTPSVARIATFLPRSGLSFMATSCWSFAPAGRRRRLRFPPAVRGKRGWDAGRREPATGAQVRREWERDEPELRWAAAHETVAAREWIAARERLAAHEGVVAAGGVGA